MKPLLSRCALGTAIAISLSACGGSGSEGVAGIGGSGYISSGTVTGFGSVFVNGVEFETSGTVFDIDDSGAGSQSDLAIGMVVTVNGTVNTDGITGTATSISYDDQLQGPVSAVSLPDPDGNIRTITILGNTVRISAIDTVYDVSGLLPVNTIFGFDNIGTSNNVEVSGFFNTAGELVATRVELKSSTFISNSNDDNGIIELKGTISGFSDISSPFSLEGLKGISIDASSTLELDNVPNDTLSNGLTVEVKGTCADLSCSTIEASRVEGQSGFDDADKISVEGLVTDYVNDSSFKVNGISVDASGAILSPTTLDLRNGARVEVEGPISNNIIQAIKVELRGGDARVHATVSRVDPVTGNFEVTANAQTIAVTVTTETEKEGAIAIGNFVNVRGFEGDNGGITATKVEVKDKVDDIIVQGNITSLDYIQGNSITVLGVTFTVDAGGETEFQDINDNKFNTEQDFVNALIGTKLVKVKDKNDKPVFGVADEIEIESP